MRAGSTFPRGLYALGAVRFLRIMKLRLLALLALLPLAACSTFNGKIVKKRSRPAEPGFSRLGPTFTLEIEGANASGKPVRRTALVSEEEYMRYHVGDRYPAPEKQNDGGTAAEKNEKRRPEKTDGAHQPASAKPSPAKVKKAEAEKPKPKKAGAKSQTEPAEPPAKTAMPAPSPAAAAMPKVSATPAPAAQPQLSYEEAETRAAEDARVRALKQKIHTASSEEEQRKAADEYYRTLFGKMRELAPAAKARIDKEQAAKLKAISSPGQ